MERIKTFAISAPPDLGLLELTNALPLSELADPRLHFGLFHSEFQPSDATTAPLIEFAPYDCRPAAFSAFARAWEQMELMRAV